MNNDIPIWGQALMVLVVVVFFVIQATFAAVACWLIWKGWGVLMQHRRREVERQQQMSLPVRLNAPQYPTARAAHVTSQPRPIPTRQAEDDPTSARGVVENEQRMDRLKASLAADPPVVPLTPAPTPAPEDAIVSDDGRWWWWIVGARWVPVPRDDWGVRGEVAS